MLILRMMTAQHLLVVGGGRHLFFSDRRRRRKLSGDPSDRECIHPRGCHRGPSAWVTQCVLAVGPGRRPHHRPGVRLKDLTKHKHQ
jgi:hypothetical protein